MNPGFFNEQLEQILQAQMKPSPFVEVYKGKYARLDKIVAFSNDMAYFDHAATLGVKINLATQTRLQEKYPPVLMY
jgi:pyridoxine 5'-phosphate synthase PdxJ